MTGVLIKRGHLDRERHAHGGDDMRTIVYSQGTLVSPERGTGQNVSFRGREALRTL